MTPPRVFDVMKSGEQFVVAVVKSDKQFEEFWQDKWPWEVELYQVDPSSWLVVRAVCLPRPISPAPFPFVDRIQGTGRRLCARVAAPDIVSAARRAEELRSNTSSDETELHPRRKLLISTPVLPADFDPARDDLHAVDKSRMTTLDEGTSVTVIARSGGYALILSGDVYHWIWLGHHGMTLLPRAEP